MTVLRRTATLVVVLVLGFTASLGVTFGSPASAATSSAVTLNGSGEFGDLRVTVGQTENLVSQVVRISWTGAKPTTPGASNFGVNYLQIMQCWGDAASGPTREQCQFGGFFADTRGGEQSSSRQVNGNVTDPLEPLKPPAGSTANVYVPFKAFDGEESTGATSDLFSADTTNEVPYAITRPDGKGEEFFNMQSVADAPGLGCGSPVRSGATVTGRSCWLVVVPRGDREVDGSVRTGQGNDRLNTSPLSTSNWASRIQTKLGFEPVGDSCPIGNAERRTIGQELVSEAVLRWQPALCAGDGAIYGYSQVPDDTSRRVLKTDKPGMVFVGRGLTAAENPDKLKITYAPIAVGGLSIGFVVDSQSIGKAPADVKLRDGQRLTRMKLTPRLVAKLLTQTYSRAVHPSAPSVDGNPTDLTQDQEFKALNPEFDALRISLPELLLPAGRSDTFAQVWTWLLTDADAKAFLAGKPDPWGTKVNPNYTDLGYPRPDYPKADPYCLRYSDDRTPQCTLDLHPYASDMHDAARNASRGDTLVKGDWVNNGTDPPGWKKSAPQYSGSRAMLTLVDTASAARYGLQTAAIRNASGQFVQPTSATLLAAAAAMKPSAVSTVLTPTPNAKGSNVYPLTTVGYAATVPSALDGSARKDYAAFLRYAAGPGQNPGLLPGELPAGYAPLTTAMRNQTKAAATAILAGRALSSPTDDGTGTSSSSDPSVSATSAGTSTGVSGTTAVDPALATGGTLADPAVPVALRTPTDAAGLARIVPFLALGLGLAAAVGGPVMLALARRRTVV